MAKLNVLLIDDEEDYVTTLAERLIQRGLPCRIALGGQQALFEVDSRPPEVIVLDLNMPEMDGFSVLRKLKQRQPDVQVIILSAFLDPVKERRLKDAGALACLGKPVDIEILAACITSAAANRT